MEPVLEILAYYIKPIGIESFGESLYQAARSLERFCRQASDNSLSSIVEKSGIQSPGSLNGWTLPDAVWLAACRKSSALHCYPMGEIAERAFKKTIIRLAFFINQTKVGSPDADLKTIQKNIRKSIANQQIAEVLALFLGDYLYEICRDWERRLRSGSKNDSCYQYHFLKDGNPRSLSAERKSKQALLGRCKSAAKKLLPALFESIRGKSSEPLRARLSQNYIQVTGKSLKRNKPRQHRTPPLNVIVGKKPKAELEQSFTLDPRAVRLLVGTEKANIALRYAQIEGIIKHPLHSLSKDLLDIGAVIYFADQMVRRSDTLGRRLDIFFPVRHVALWKKVDQLLAETVSCLGRDEVHFHFTKRMENMQPVKFQVANSRGCVCLLSGGLDSAAGAVWTLRGELEPIFVSHYSNPYMGHLQRDLVAELESRHYEHLQQASVFVGKPRKIHVSHRLSSPPETPMTQFLRSFLFLCMASVVAIESGIRKLYVFENGPIALNPMFSEGRVNTRTAHPRFLAQFQALVEALFKLELEIENPFMYETKGETISRLAQPELRGLVRMTNSCWNWSNVPIRAKILGRTNFNGRHDGDCLPCVVRRASIEHADLDESDVPYLMDIFTEFSQLSPTAQVLIADYLRFCENFETLEGADLLLEHTDFSVYVKGMDPQKLVSMYKRHAGEMIESFHKRGSSDTQRLVLPPLT